MDTTTNVNYATTNLGTNIVYTTDHSMITSDDIFSLSGIIEYEGLFKLVSKSIKENTKHIDIVVVKRDVPAILRDLRLFGTAMRSNRKYLKRLYLGETLTFDLKFIGKRLSITQAYSQTRKGVNGNYILESMWPAYDTWIDVGITKNNTTPAI